MLWCTKIRPWITQNSPSEITHLSAAAHSVAHYIRAGTIPQMKSSDPADIPSALKNSIHKRLAPWFQRCKRPMPWRNTSDPYAIWLSEVMLQQTQVATVEPYYQRFLQHFPDIDSLAAAPLEEVLKLWAGLGYYRRARSLHRAAQFIASTYHSVFPCTYDQILQLPGIGPYTAGAIASIAFREAVPVLDGNVMRVLTRLLLIQHDIARPQTRKLLWKIAGSLVPNKNPGDFNQAMMELGATVCTPTRPRCESCPLATLCAARREHLQHRFPVRQSKSATPRISVAAVIIRSPQGRLMARRKPGGLWEHLWEFPAFELVRPTAAGVSKHFFALTGLRIKLKRHPATLAHQLTHRRMEYTLFTGRSLSAAKVELDAKIASPYDAVRWITDLTSVPKSRLTEKISALAG